MFGLPFLDIYFCSQEYAKLLRHKGIPAVYKQIKSDHWFVLGSKALQEALRDELPKFGSKEALLQRQSERRVQ
jgi:hypothetical protein